MKRLFITSLVAASDVALAYPLGIKKTRHVYVFLVEKMQESNGNTPLGELSDYVTTNVKQASYDVHG